KARAARTSTSVKPARAARLAPAIIDGRSGANFILQTIPALRDPKIVFVAEFLLAKHDRLRTRLADITLGADPDGGKIGVLDGGALALAQQFPGRWCGNFDGQALIQLVLDRLAIQIGQVT